MSDHNERACRLCGSLLHHEDDCERRKLRDAQDIELGANAPQPQGGEPRCSRCGCSSSRPLWADASRTIICNSCFERMRFLGPEAHALRSAWSIMPEPQGGESPTPETDAENSLDGNRVSIPDCWDWVRIDFARTLERQRDEALNYKPRLVASLRDKCESLMKERDAALAELERARDKYTEEERLRWQNVHADFVKANEDRAQLRADLAAARTRITQLEKEKAIRNYRDDMSH